MRLAWPSYWPSDAFDFPDFEALVDPLRALLPVADGALDLAFPLEDAIAGDGPDGFRPESLVDVESEDDGQRATFKKRAVHRLARAYGMRVSYRTVSRWVNELKVIGIVNAGEYEQRTGVRYSADPATLTRALSVLPHNGGFKVAAVRRFRRLVDGADGSLTWLTWARDTLYLAGDRCELDPHQGGTPRMAD